MTFGFFLFYNIFWFKSRFLLIILSLNLFQNRWIFLFKSRFLFIVLIFSLILLLSALLFLTKLIKLIFLFKFVKESAISLKIIYYCGIILLNKFYIISQLFFIYLSYVITLITFSILLQNTQYSRLFIS